jgi:hypothetical protein
VLREAVEFINNFSAFRFLTFSLAHDITLAAKRLRVTRISLLNGANMEILPCTRLSRCRHREGSPRQSKFVSAPSSESGSYLTLLPL